MGRGGEGPTSFPSPISPGLQGRPHSGVQAVTQAAWVSGNSRGLVPRTGAQAGMGVGNEAKASYQNWDTLHVGLAFFTFSHIRPWGLAEPVRLGG